MTKWVLRLASGVTACNSVVGAPRARRGPSSARRSSRLRTSRMKKTISSGLMSVPVAIMSTVTAMRGIVAVAEGGEQFLGVRLPMFVSR